MKKLLYCCDTLEKNLKINALLHDIFYLANNKKDEKVYLIPYNKYNKINNIKYCPFCGKKLIFYD